MAKKAAAKKPAATKPAENKNVQVRVVVDPQPDLPTYYLNYVEVGRMEHDFFILGTQLPVKPSAAKIAAARESGEIHVDATLQILVPATLVDGIIHALTTQKKLYDEHRKKAAAAAAPMTGPKLNS